MQYSLSLLCSRFYVESTSLVMFIYWGDCLLLQTQSQSKYAVHMSPSTRKFELFMRGLACSIVGVCLAGDDRAAGTESCWSSLITTVRWMVSVRWCNIYNKTKSVHLRYFCKLWVMEMIWSQVLSNIFLVDRVV
jgi:hypothetical protein